MVVVDCFGGDMMIVISCALLFSLLVFFFLCCLSVVFGAPLLMAERTMKDNECEAVLLEIEYPLATIFNA